MNVDAVFVTLSNATGKDSDLVVFKEALGEQLHFENFGSPWAAVDYEAEGMYAIATIGMLLLDGVDIKADIFLGIPNSYKVDLAKMSNDPFYMKEIITIAETMMLQLDAIDYKAWLDSKHIKH